MKTYFILLCLVGSSLLSNQTALAHEDKNIPVSSQFFVNAPLLLPEFNTLEPDKVLLSAKILDGQKKIKISWITPVAYKSSVFIVQRSRDMQNFEDIASADANFDPAKKSLYSYTDDGYSKGQFYYRLVEHKEDGTIKVSEPVAVTLSSQKVAEAQITVETIAQTKQNIHVKGSFPEDTEIMLVKGLTEMGVVADFKKIDDTEIILMPTYQLSAGEYAIKTRNNGVIKKYKFIIPEENNNW